MQGRGSSGGILCVQNVVVLQASLARAQRPNEVDMAGK